MCVLSSIGTLFRFSYTNVVDYWSTGNYLHIYIYTYLTQRSCGKSVLSRCHQQLKFMYFMYCSLADHVKNEYTYPKKGNSNETKQNVSTFNKHSLHSSSIKKPKKHKNFQWGKSLDQTTERIEPLGTKVTQLSFTQIHSTVTPLG